MLCISVVHCARRPSDTNPTEKFVICMSIYKVCCQTTSLFSTGNCYFSELDSNIKDLLSDTVLVLPLISGHWAVSSLSVAFDNHSQPFTPALPLQSSSPGRCLLISALSVNSTLSFCPRWIFCFFWTCMPVDGPVTIPTIGHELWLLRKGRKQTFGGLVSTHGL